MFDTLQLFRDLAYPTCLSYKEKSIRKPTHIVHPILSSLACDIRYVLELDNLCHRYKNFTFMCKEPVSQGSGVRIDN